MSPIHKQKPSLLKAFHKYNMLHTHITEALVSQDKIFFTWIFGFVTVQRCNLLKNEFIVL